MAGKSRSPNYPSMGLGEAVELLKAFWEREHRTRVPSEVAALALGFKSLSGPAKTSLGALHQYGLLERNKDGVKVSDLGLSVLHPASEEDARGSLAEAA